MIPLCRDGPQDSKQIHEPLGDLGVQATVQFPQRAEGLEGKVYQRFPWNSEPINRKLVSSETQLTFISKGTLHICSLLRRRTKIHVPWLLNDLLSGFSLPVRMPLFFTGIRWISLLFFFPETFKYFLTYIFRESETGLYNFQKIPFKTLKQNRTRMFRGQFLRHRLCGD